MSTPLTSHAWTFSEPVELDSHCSVVMMTCCVASDTYQQRLHIRRRDSVTDHHCGVLDFPDRFTKPLPTLSWGRKGIIASLGILSQLYFT